MESVVAVRPGYTSGHLDPDNAAARPQGSLQLHYRLYNGHTAHSAALLTASIGDGVMAPVHREIKLPEYLDQATGVFDLIGSWPNPFPSALFGFHRVTLDLWAVDLGGQPLPAEVQTNPPDTRLFLRGSGDTGSLYLEPGCRSSGGLEWSELKSFSVTPSTVDLDASGKRIAPGQKVTVKWDCADAALPATQFGYPGSWRGVWIYGPWRLPDPTGQIFSPVQSGQLVLDMGGKEYWSGMGVFVAPYAYSLTSCNFAPRFIELVGIQPTVPPPPPAPAELFGDTWYEPAFIHPGTPFTVHFTAINGGGTATGPFVARLQLGNGVQTEDVDIPSISPGSAQDIYWPFNSGLAAGNHWFYCYLDWTNAVTEVSKLNNTISLGMIVG
jgi:hypothetical protein